MAHIVRPAHYCLKHAGRYCPSRFSIMAAMAKLDLEWIAVFDEVYKGTGVAAY